MTKRQARVICALSALCVALALLLSRRLWFRVDVTANRAYTIAPASRNLHGEIPDQVRITYYVSDKLAAIHPLPGEIEDLLREYAAYSRGKIRLNVRDPVKANMAQAAEALGIQPQQIRTVERDQDSVATVYTGIVIEYLDRAETLPVVFSLNTLEYDLTTRIRGLVRERGRALGVLVGDAARQWEQDYRYLNEALSGAGYQTRLLSPGAEIDGGLQGLLVLGGAEELDGPALDAIDRYIQGGGRALFALKGVAVDAQYGISARPVNDQGLLAMLASYGAVIKPELVLDAASRTLTFSSPGPGGGQEIRFVRYPHWVDVLPENGNPDHPVSAAFGGADLFWPGGLELSPPGGVEGVPLFTSTPEAWRMTRDFAVDPNADYLFALEAAETRGTQVFAAALTGVFPRWEDAGSAPGTAKEARLVVIADADLAHTPNVQYARSQRNMDFFVQAADWLSNDDDIIGIRNRQGQAGPLNRIVDKERREAAMAFARIFNTAVMPALTVALGLVIALRRRRSLDGAVRGDQDKGGASDDV